MAETEIGFDRESNPDQEESASAHVRLHMAVRPLRGARGALFFHR